MPRFRTLSAAEIAAMEQHSLGARAQIAQEYDAYLADFTVGDYGRVELHEDERRAVVRQRLHAAARRRGLALRFRPGRGPLIFCVEAGPSADAALAAATSILARVAPQPVMAPRRPHRKRKPGGRYDKLLPRWMRDGQHESRRSGRAKRRPR